MVLINDKKYSCATCIKGHRSSSCTHTDRPLFEVKKKGRPVTQCVHCRKLRKDRALHIRCDCAAKEGTSTPVDAPLPASTTSTDALPAPASAATTAIPAPVKAPALATGTGSATAQPAFPNGFRDVHAMNQAAEALHALTRGSDDSSVIEAKVRRVDALLNPCRCQSGGKCHCCRPRPRQDPAPRSSGASTPLTLESGASTSTDKLADMFSTVSTSTLPPLPDAETSRVPPAFLYRQPPPLPSHLDSSIHVSDSHHPAHTSPYVHKAKLYSPYSPNLRHMSDLPGSGGASRPPARPHRSSSSSSSLDHSHPHSNGGTNNTLPSIRALSAAGARRTRIKDLVLPRLLDFPTAMEITLDGCTCGEGCACPGCAVHPQQESSTTSPLPNIETGKSSFSGHTARWDPATCPTSCTSCFDCRARVSVPAGIPTIDQLITVASSSIPAPSHCRPNKTTTEPGDGATAAFDLDGYHTSVLPSAVLRNEEAAEAWGLTNLKPLECCNGRCQCSPGNCKCDTDCCGCCSFCSCSDSAVPDSGQPMHVDENSPHLQALDPASSSSAHLALAIRPPLTASTSENMETSSCCRSESSTVPLIHAAAALGNASDHRSSELPATSVDTHTTRPQLGTGYSSTSSASQADTEIIDICSPEIVSQPITKSCCAGNTSNDPLLPSPPLPPAPAEFAAPALSARSKPRPLVPSASSLSRSSSTGKSAPATHTPKPILPRPTSAASSNAHNVSVIQTKNGAKHQLILPTSSRTMQVEKSLQRRASGRKACTTSSSGTTKSGAATPLGMPGNIRPLAGTDDLSLDGTRPQGNTTVVSHQQEGPFNNHAFDPLPVVPVCFAHSDEIGGAAGGPAATEEALEDDGIWDLIDDGERWILPSAPPPDDLLAGFIPEGYGMSDGTVESTSAGNEERADLMQPQT